MADLLFRVSRTAIIKKGKVDEHRLREVFDDVCGAHCVSMHVEYDKRNDTTRVLLSPCRTIEEFTQDKNGDQINYRTLFEVDKSIMSSIAKSLGGYDAFVQKVWMPYKKTRAKGSVVLPSINERGDCVTFELLLNSCKLEGKKPMTSTARNRTMKKANSFLVEYFAEQAEHCKSSRSIAKTLDELSLIVAEALSVDEKAAI